MVRYFTAACEPFHLEDSTIIHSGISTLYLIRTVRRYGNKCFRAIVRTRGTIIKMGTTVSFDGDFFFQATVAVAVIAGGWGLYRALDLVNPVIKVVDEIKRGSTVVILTCGDLPTKMREEIERANGASDIQWRHCDTFGQQVKETDSLMGLNRVENIGALIVVSPFVFVRDMCKVDEKMGRDMETNWLRTLGRVAGSGTLPTYGIILGNYLQATARLTVLRPSKFWGLLPPEFTLYDEGADPPTPPCVKHILDYFGIMQNPQRTVESASIKKA